MFKLPHLGSQAVNFWKFPVLGAAVYVEQTKGVVAISFPDGFYGVVGVSGVQSAGNPDKAPANFEQAPSEVGNCGFFGKRQELAAIGQNFLFDVVPD